MEKSSISGVVFRRLRAYSLAVEEKDEHQEAGNFRCVSMLSFGTGRAVEVHGHWETLTQLPACDARGAHAISRVSLTAAVSRAHTASGEVLKSQCLELLEECGKAEQLVSMLS